MTPTDIGGEGDMSELLPCPFCGCQPELEGKESTWAVTCPLCPAQTYWREHDEAIRLWNTRHPEPAQAQVSVVTDEMFQRAAKCIAEHGSLLDAIEAALGVDPSAHLSAPLPDGRPLPGRRPMTNPDSLAKVAAALRRYGHCNWAKRLERLDAEMRKDERDGLEAAWRCFTVAAAEREELRARLAACEQLHHEDVARNVRLTNELITARPTPTAHPDVPGGETAPPK